MKKKRTCEEKGCRKPYYAKGLCRLHYNRKYNGVQKQDNTETLERLAREQEEQARLLHSIRRADNWCMYWAGVRDALAGEIKWQEYE